jgi:hypothetical protein
VGSGIDATSLGAGVVVGALSLEGGSVSGGVSTDCAGRVGEGGGGEAVGTVHRLQAGSRRRRSRFHRRMTHLISIWALRSNRIDLDRWHEGGG